MPGPESRLQKKIKKALEKHYPGSFWFVVHGGMFQQAGLPDLLGCVHGRYVGMEVKLPGEPHPLTELQKWTLDQIDNADGIAAVAHSVDEAIEITELALGGMYDWRRQGYHDNEEAD